jgi:hypothetical protein
MCLLLWCAEARAQLVITGVPDLELAPTQIGTVRQDDDAGIAPWCGISRGGRSILPGFPEFLGGRTNRVAVGVLRKNIPGTWPFPCHEIWSIHLAGRVMFATPRLPPGRRVSSARLIVSETDREATLAKPSRCNTAIGAVAPITELWMPGLVFAPVRAGVGELSFIARPPGRTTAIHSINITSIVSDWFEGRRPNLGLALLGVQDTVLDANVHCAAYLHNMRLRFRLRRA